MCHYPGTTGCLAFVGITETSASLFRIVPENLLLVNMRPVEGEKAVMLQLREIGGKAARFAVEPGKVAPKQLQPIES